MIDWAVDLDRLDLFWVDGDGGVLYAGEEGVVKLIH